MPMPMPTDQTCTAAGSGVSLLTISAAMKPRPTPTTPPIVDSVTDSVRICQMMSRRRAERLAQTDFARALADHHQHDVHDDDAADHERQRDDADEDREEAGRRRAVDAEQRVGREHAEVVRLLRPQPPLDPHRHRRIVHRRLHQLGVRGLTSSCMPGREPNILRNVPSGMIANLSCDCPKIDPFFSLTPTTRKCTPPILMVLSSGSTGPNSLSATSQPRTVTGRLRSISVWLISRPRSASNVEK